MYSVWWSPGESIIIGYHVIAAPWTETHKRWNFTGVTLTLKTKKQTLTCLPSLDFFFLTRVPPNFPRKDSSFFIFVDGRVAFAVGLPDIFQCVSFLFCVTAALLTSLLPVMHLGSSGRPANTLPTHTLTEVGWVSIRWWAPMWAELYASLFTPPLVARWGKTVSVQLLNIESNPSHKWAFLIVSLVRCYV